MTNIKSTSATFVATKSSATKARRPSSVAKAKHPTRPNSNLGTSCGLRRCSGQAQIGRASAQFKLIGSNASPASNFRFATFDRHQTTPSSRSSSLMAHNGRNRRSRRVTGVAIRPPFKQSFDLPALSSLTASPNIPFKYK